MRDRVMPRSSRMSASSSTTSTWFFVMPASSSGPAQHPEMSAGVGFHVIELRAVGLAHFARDIQAETGAARRRREERLEELVAQRRRDARTIVRHIQFYDAVARIHVDAHADAAVSA